MVTNGGRSVLILGGRSVLILKSLMCYWVNNLDLQNMFALYTNGTSGTGVIIGLTLLWYHGVHMTPGLFDRLNIPNFEIISFHLALYFLCRFLSTAFIYLILILMLPFLQISLFICLRSY